MVFGHNSNLKIGVATFHVQTEDRGESHALIDTTVYCQGRVVHRRTNNYFDLLPLDEDRQQALKLRLEDQHRTVIDEIRNGTVQLAIPPLSSAPLASVHRAAPLENLAVLLVELVNANSWLSGKHAKLLLSVREQNGKPVAGARVLLEIEGADKATPVRTVTTADGHAQIEFEMPRVVAASAVLAIHVEHHAAKGHLRFALRAKPRVA